VSLKTLFILLLASSNVFYSSQVTVEFASEPPNLEGARMRTQMGTGVNRAAFL
jgi:hypothetical protein